MGEKSLLERSEGDIRCLWWKGSPCPSCCMSLLALQMMSSWTGWWRRVQGGWSSCSNPVRLAAREQDSTGNTSSSFQNNTIKCALESNENKFNKSFIIS